jgi:hypothetical protein
MRGLASGVLHPAVQLSLAMAPYAVLAVLTVRLASPSASTEP